MDFNDLSFNFIKSSIKINKDEFKVYAHENELLHDHIIKTQYVFYSLVDNNVLLNFYNYFHKNNYIDLSYAEFNDIIMDFIAFHDIGKISPNFQINRLNKKNHKIRESQISILKNNNLTELINQFVSYHSFSSSLSFLAKYKDIFNENRLFILILSYAINGHHTNLKDVLFKDEFAYNHNFNEYIISVSYLILFLDIANLNQINEMKFSQNFFQDMQDSATKCKTLNDSNFSFFYNYVYSLLITSDVFATNKFNQPFNAFKKIKFNNRITTDLKKKMIKTFYEVDYNKNLNFETVIEDISDISDINILRKNMLLESSKILKENISLNNNSKIFYLNMPTGAGKTNTSMKLALDLIENTNANRIIYAMPFINIIEQNYDIICNNFGLNDDNSEVRKIYSGSETLFDDMNISNIILMDNFFNYPVVCTTFSSFFNCLSDNSKRNKFKLSAFTNSIVILDEIQSLPLDNWISLYYLISEMSEKYNIYFIIMSATLPNFEKLKLDFYNTQKYNSSISLINNPQKYFDHFLFDRTEINQKIMELSVNDEKSLKHYLLEEILRPNFKNGFKKGLIILNTIKTSRLIFDLLSDYDDEFDIDLLNSSLLPSIKQKIIYKINNNAKKKKNYILVSTQSIEAGVDVSFDFIVRDFAILDSIEQVRGRCNRSRELNKYNPHAKGKIYIILLKNQYSEINNYIYNSNEIKTRIKQTKRLISNKFDYSYEDIKKYYDCVSYDINKLEDYDEKDFRFNDRDNISHWNLMEYTKLKDVNDGINIIDNKLNQYSIFIPTNIDIFKDISDFGDLMDIHDEELGNLYELNKKNFIFSLNELRYLIEIEKNENSILFDNFSVNGDKLICYYNDLIEKTKGDYLQTKLIQKEFSSILYKFIINISINDSELEAKIETFEKMGYFYILPKDLIGDSEEELYSIKWGFNNNPQITEIL